MWDLSRLVLIQRARNALAEGRLDEAYELVTGRSVREHRQCQILLERLVEPLLERARAHLAAGRAEDALSDVERAQAAGGNRPATADVRERALAALRERQLERRQERELTMSVHRHIERGRLAAGEARLKDGPPGSEERASLELRLERLARTARESRDRAGACLERGDLDGALEAAREAVAAAREEPATVDLLARIAGQVEPALRQAFTAGAVERGRHLLDRLVALGAGGFDRELWAQVADSCVKAAAAVAHGDWQRARICLGRLKGLGPEAKWVASGDEQLKAIEEAVRELKAGPLGSYASAVRPGAGAGRGADAGATVLLGKDGGAPPAVPTLIGAAPPASPSPARPRAAPPAGPYHLWVEGVGTYLLLAGDRITLGRAGSSARPDIALPADIDGIHAEIVRVDHDYFLVPRSAAAVGGRRVERHLLAGGDEVTLGARARFTFRLPSSLSTTAVLELAPGLRLDGDVRRAILLDGHLILGGTPACHVLADGGAGLLVLSLAEGGFHCRAPEPILVDGKTHRAGEVIPLHTAVEVGPLTFTLTCLRPQGGAS